MDISKIRRLILYVLTVVSVTVAQRSPKTDIQYRFNLGHERATVATVGPIVISSEEFRLNYDFGPAFLKRLRDSKKRYMDVMINEKVLALEGYAHHLDKTEQVKNSLALVKADLITEELFKDDVMANISIAEKDIYQSVQQDLKHIHIKWLYRRSLQRIKDDFHQLQNDISFDSLFNAQLTPSVRIDDRSLETTLFKLRRKNPVLMSIIDTMKFGTLTPPIKVDDGFYILKVVSGRTDILLTQTEWNNRSEKMRNALYKQKMDSISDKYVDDLLRANKPVIKRPVFNLLRTWLAKNVLPEKLFDTWGFLNNTIMGEEQNIDKKILEYASSELVSMIHGRLSLSEFMAWYNLRSGYVKLSHTTKDDFAVSVQNIIWRMVRDTLLTQRALYRGLQNRKNVVRQIRWWKDKIVFSKFKQDLANSVKITKAEERVYYKKNKDAYLKKNGTIQPFDQVKTEIRTILFREKYGANLIHHVLAARQKYKINVNTEILNQIRVDTENDVHAIDVYTVKKNGLIPRQPYPTIDSEWRYWY